MRCCDKCDSDNVKMLNKIYYQDENCEPTEEIEGYQYECLDCWSFWDECQTKE